MCVCVCAGADFNPNLVGGRVAAELLHGCIVIKLFVIKLVVNCAIMCD